MFGDASLRRAFRLIPWLAAETPFPPVSRALRSPNGLLAAGADLSPKRLLSAYRLGIYPWFSEGDPILWWSPDPRMVLVPDEFRVTRSFAKTLRNARYEVRVDTSFRAVMEACAAPRDGQDGTWITTSMIDAYVRMHELGHAHSFETWIDGELAGGLYGMAVGRVIFGESMFTRVRDASKIALAHLVRHAQSQGFELIDCQMETSHLASLGARPIPREEFSARIAELVNSGPEPQRWETPAAAFEASP
jgi:leucyl/phenylalanyl-tRNA---protein transferase